jgi:putative hydrolases of HD superfamily
MENVVAFVLELEKLKAVERKIRPIGQTRLENSAEHSWQLCLLAWSLAPHAPEGVDVMHAIRMLLVHDIGEIDAGDVMAFAAHDAAARQAAERAGVARVVALLGGSEAAEYLALWDEFDAAGTPTARFARAVDRAMPVLLNLANHGQSWCENGISHARVVQRVQGEIEAGCPALWAHVSAELNAAHARGFFTW